MARHKNTNSDLRRSQATIRYGLEALTEEEMQKLELVDLHSRFYTSMLIDDASLFAMPISMSRSGAKAMLDPPNDAAEDLAAYALRRDCDGRDLGEAVCDFIRDCAQTIVEYSYAPYEIVYLYSPESDVAVGFELFSINPSTLLMEDNQLVQYVPERYVASGNFPSRIKVNPDHLVVFEPSAQDRESLDEAVVSLLAIERCRGMNLAIESLQQNLPYDFGAHQYAEHAALAEATRKIGWDARGTFRDEQTEYHQTYRYLIFWQFLLRLRDGILKRLNDTFETISRTFPSLGRLRLEGLPSLADADAALKHLEAGDRSFTEILAPFFSR